MKSEVWGKHLWYSIHFIALDYPENPSNEDKRDYQLFYENLHKVIPCYKCSLNYIKHLKERPLEQDDLESPETLFRWTVDIHNIVNRDLKKKQISYDEALKIYRNFESHVNRSSTTNMCQVFMIVLLTLLLFILLVMQFMGYIRFVSKR